MLESLLAQYEYECWCDYNHEYIGEDGEWHSEYNDEE